MEESKPFKGVVGLRRRRSDKFNYFYNRKVLGKPDGEGEIPVCEMKIGLLM